MTLPQYSVAPTASVAVAVARLVVVGMFMFATVMGVLSYQTAIPVVVGAGAYDGRGGGLARGMRSESVGDGRGGHVRECWVGAAVAGPISEGKGW